MRYLISKLIILLCLLGAVSEVQAQTNTIVRSNEKVVVAGKIFYLHIVKEKQTLYSICKAYGADINEVMQVNNKQTHSLNLNETLKIPFKQASKDNIDTSPKTKDTSPFFFHVVEKGNTLYSLSKQYDQSIEIIKFHNPEIKRNNKLSIGTTLKIPNKDIPQSTTQQPYTYTVKATDSESDILQKFDIKRRKFRKLNSHIQSFKNIKAGTLVNLPKNAKIIAPEPTEKPSDKIDQTKVTDTDVYPDEKLTDKTTENVDYITNKRPILRVHPIDTTVQSKIEMALFLPLYATLNDSLNWEYALQNTVQVKTRKVPETIYPKSREFIRLYQGVLLAVEDLKKQGLEVNLHVFDTEQDQAKVRKILNGLTDLKLDLILGPVYSNTFELVAQYAQTNQIPIVSPLSSRNKELSNNPFVFQLNTSTESLCDNIVEYLVSDKENKNIIILHGEDYKESDEYKLVSSIEQQLFKDGKYWQHSNLSYSKVSYDDYGIIGLEQLLSETKENVIVVPSSRPVVVETFLTNIKFLSKSYPIKLIGFPSWQRFNSMDPSTLFELNTQILSPYSIDYNSENVIAFVDRFRYEFNCEPTDYSFRAYDFTRYFSNAIKRYGPQFFDYLSLIRDIELLQSNFKLESVSSWGGFENKGLYIISYSDDFEIKVEKFEPTTDSNKDSNLMEGIIRQ